MNLKRRHEDFRSAGSIQWSVIFFIDFLPRCTALDNDIKREKKKFQCPEI